MTSSQTNLLAPVLRYLANREGLGLTLDAITGGVTDEGHEAHKDDTQAALNYLASIGHVSVIGSSLLKARYAITPAGTLAHETNS